MGLHPTAVTVRRDLHPADQPRRRRPAQRAGADPAGGDAGHRPGRHRRHRPRDGGARGGRGPRRVHPVPVAVLDLPAHPGRHGPALLQARRPVRPEADDPGRCQRVPARLTAVRARLEHDGADRVPRGAGHRRRSGPADRHDHRRRHLLHRGAGQGAGLPRRGLGALRRHRSRRWAGSSPTTCPGAGSSSSTCRSVPRRSGCSGAGSRSGSSGSRTGSTCSARCSSPAAG